MARDTASPEVVPELRSEPALETAPEPAPDLLGTCSNLLRNLLPIGSEVFTVAEDPGAPSMRLLHVIEHCPIIFWKDLDPTMANGPAWPQSSVLCVEVSQK